MTAIAALVALAAAVALVLGSVHAVRRRRREPLGERLAIATPGGRALANNVGSLSDFRMELRLPRSRR